MRIAAIALLLVLPQQESKPWIGISPSVVDKLPAVEGVTAKLAIRVDDMPLNSPAAKCGVKRGDLILAMDDTGWDDPKEAINAFRATISSKKAGDVIVVRVIRDAIEGMPEGPIEEAVRKLGTVTLKHTVSVVEIKVTLESRPAPSGKAIPANLDFPAGAAPEAALASALIEERKLAAAGTDLAQRLASLHATTDAFRLHRVAHAHRHPFQVRTFCKVDDPSYAHAVRWLDVVAAESMEPKPGIDGLIDRIKEVRAQREKAFARLSADEMKFLTENIDSLTTLFAEHIYLDGDADKTRFARHARVLDIATRVDYGALLHAGALLQACTSTLFLDGLKTALTREWEAKGKPGGVFLEKDTEIGKVVLAGHERTWHRADAAVLLDLGGSDFYSNRAQFQVDFDGDDNYEATGPWAQGAAKLDVVALVDVAGNDQYIGTRWAQGAAVLGVGMLFDLAGDDTYRGDTYCQAVGLWGIGYLKDDAGNDRYEAHHLSQGVGMPGGAGWLVDAKGDDRYYAKGTKPTTYGDYGIFDGWSQGCGVGFRGLQSGGVGLVWDGDGADRYEAGNFSQGGGYYFGIGLMRDAKGNDRYIGSRYNQGFSAHQAVGFFEDLAGDDTYDTRQGVAQGLAWDQCVTVFIDHGGNDTYDGGAFFSQGAAAHNAVCIFLDLGGRDTYRYPPGQAQVAGNDYHGGTSFALFIDAGGEKDDFSGVDRNNSILYVKDHGFACDLPGAIKDAKVKELLRP